MMDDEGKIYLESYGNFANGEKDEEMQDIIEQSKLPSQEADSTETPMSRKASSPEAAGVTTGGRRRGRRKVMKKKTMKDEEGYLGNVAPLDSKGYMFADTNNIEIQ